MYARLTFAPALIAAVLTLSLAGALAPSRAHAADDAPAAAPAHPAPDKLDSVRSLIANRQWSAALDELRRVNDTGSADWNNLMGFALRKGETPDLVASENFYDAALRIDPHHRNTLEYSGELFLMKGDLPKAQARLATLQADCAGKCEQFAQLKKAIDSFKANGNKFVSTGW